MNNLANYNSRNQVLGTVQLNNNYSSKQNLNLNNTNNTVNSNISRIPISTPTPSDLNKVTDRTDNTTPRTQDNMIKSKY
jgi:hypothetical protein